MQLNDIAAISDEPPEKTIARWSEQYVSTSRNPAIHLNSALSDYFSVRPLGRFAPPNSSITVTYQNNSMDQSTHTIDLPFSGYSPQDVGTLNDYYPPIFNLINNASPLHSYSDDDLLTFDLQVFSLSET